VILCWVGCLDCLSIVCVGLGGMSRLFVHSMCGFGWDV